jgi:hypothetical protein
MVIASLKVFTSVLWGFGLDNTIKEFADMIGKIGPTGAHA